MVKTSESRIETHEVTLAELKQLLGINGSVVEMDFVTNEVQQVVGLQYTVRVEENEEKVQV